jgi:thymidylate kinase
MTKSNQDSSTLGQLFVFEGPDDVGKTTLASMLAEHLLSLGRQNQMLSFPGREAGTLSELVYRFYHEPGEFGVSKVSPIAMQVLVTAAHIEVIEARLRPLIRTGVDIVLDRYWWSTWVYANLDRVPQHTINLLLELVMQSWEGIRPNMVFLILRDEPLLEQRSTQRWTDTLALYKEIFEHQQTKVPLKLITNEGTLDQAFADIKSALMAKANPTSYRRTDE